MILLLALLLQADVDRAIAERAGGPVAERASDAEFLRRVWLDVAGVVPTAAEARAFLADADPEKRGKLVDRLLASPDYARRMEQAVSVMFLERRGGKAVADAEWSAHLRRAFAADEPWDGTVKAMLAADGRRPETRPAMKFLADGAGGDPHRMTQDVSRLLLGRNLLCAQCHDHPLVKDYRQSEYMGLFAFLTQSKLQEDPKTKRSILVESAAKGKVEFASVFSPGKKAQAGPRLWGHEEVAIPEFEKGKEFEVAPVKGGDPGVPKFRPREILAESLVAHPQFARNSVNRFWFLLMGRGLVHPLDLDHKGNPPSHPELLEGLTKEFVEGGFRVRPLLRKILLSDAYQRSSRGTGKPESYRAALLKPLSAEQLAWSLLRATGVLEEVEKAPEGGKFSMKEYLNGKGEPPKSLGTVLQFFSETFGNPAGEPEVGFQPSTTHAFFLMNERLVLGWIAALSGRLAALDDAAAAEELYLTALSRRPGTAEAAEAAAYLAKHRTRRAAALGELAWALLASAEFRLNH
jgi:hypothetical protein